MNESADPNMEKKCPQCGASLPSGALEGLCPACLLKQGSAETGPEGTAFQPPPVAEVSRLFPHLEILAFIGKGGMGAVYKARQPALDRLVALKILPPQAISSPGFSERFNREARALARLSHPNIVGVHEFGQVNGLPFLIMEFVDGPNLRQLEQAGKLSPREALLIVPQICEALQFAHDEGIVHRDIKPENILLDKKGRVKIADFGIAKIIGRAAEPDLTETRGAIGTPHYMAPEQVETPRAVDHRADIFALGVVFYEMLTGELPLGKFAPPSRKIGVDVRLDEVVLRALEKEPERRYQHASQVKTAVETIAGSAAPTPSPPPDAAAFIREVSSRDYQLDIGSCLRRGWTLVKNDFWPLVGLYALVFALLCMANGFSVSASQSHAPPAQTLSIVALLVHGPLMGGLYLYFLRKVRREPTTVDTAFVGFSHRFLHLFLGAFVSFLLIGLGIVCFILPGIYLMVAWLFTLPLIVDKRLDFWSAMELSRKVVSKHWWKFFGFYLVLLLLKIAGFVALCVGIFVAGPIAVAALMYAYEDIFGSVQPAGARPTIAVGPSGTVVLPATPPASGGGFKKPLVIGLAVVALVFGAIVIVTSHASKRHSHAHSQPHVEDADVHVRGQVTDAVTGNPIAGARVADMFFNRGADRPVREFWTDMSGEYEFSTWNEDSHDIVVSAPNYEAAKQEYRWREPGNEREARINFELQPKPSTAGSPGPQFGPAIERVINDAEVERECVLDLDTGTLLTPRPEILKLFAAPDWAEQYQADNEAATEMKQWARSTGADLLARKSDRGVLLLDGFSLASSTADGTPANGDDYWKLSAGKITGLLSKLQQEVGKTIVLPRPVDSTMRPGTEELPKSFVFKTREGGMGVLQIVEVSDDPPAVKVRYKLVQPLPAQTPPPSPAQTSAAFAEDLQRRFDAAVRIYNPAQRDRAMKSLAVDAAKAGPVDNVVATIARINNPSYRNQVALDCVRLLTGRGLKTEATQVAQQITDPNVRDVALSEIAR
jgi:predicted Ser/Thr protein kinase